MVCATVHDIRFVEDNWESPTLGPGALVGKYGLTAWRSLSHLLSTSGWPRVLSRHRRITYGIERIAMYLQGVDSIYDLVWSDGPAGTVTYGDVFHQNEVEMSRYNFEEADVEHLFTNFDHCESEACV